MDALFLHLKMETLKIPNSSIFNLSIFPDSYGDCQINNDTKLIECYNKEEIENSIILIEESVVKSLDGKELFLLKDGVKSDSDDISLLISDNKHLKEEDPGNPNTTDDTTTPSPPSPPAASAKNFFNKASEDRGLSGGAIAGIIIACVVAIAAALGIAYLIKSREKTVAPIEQIDAIQIGNSTDIGTSVGHFDTTTA